MEWIYDFVHEAVFYEVYENDDETRYAWVTHRDFAEIVNEVTQYILDEYNGVEEPTWQQEESAHLDILDYMGSYIG
jgi:hypothetical protein